MKRTLYFIFLILITDSSFAQKPGIDSNYRPDIYKSRVELFKSFPHSKKDIVFLGNSITFWTDWNELLQIKNAKNRGIPGDLTFGVLERLDEVIDGKPAKVFILIGINDIARKIPDSLTINNYKKMVQRIKSGSSKTKIYLQSLFPTNDSFNKLPDHYKNEKVILLNTALKYLAGIEKIQYIDLYSDFIDNEKKLKKEYTFDGVHLTAKGYAKWAEILKKGKYLDK
jgi:lysophospholipase L1-like esterase